jgi:uncharacterized protein YndB with AHSA1/START domain
MEDSKLAERPFLNLSRSYPVAPEKVWRAWADAEAIKRRGAGVYKEVVPNRRLMFTWTWPNSTPERESMVTIAFKAVAGGTELDLRHEQFFDEGARDGHKRGWGEALDKLDGFLRSDQPAK